MATPNVDKSLSFGMQNFVFCQSDETDGTYNYYGYIDKKGMVLIMRTNKALSAAKYYAAVGAFDTVFAGKAGFTYGYINTITDPKIA